MTEQNAQNVRENLQKEIKNAVELFVKDSGAISLSRLNYIEDSINRVRGRLVKLMKDRDYIERRLNLLDSVNLNDMMLESNYPELIESVCVNDQGDSNMSFIVSTKMIEIPYHLTTIGEDVIIPVGKFEIKVTKTGQDGEVLKVNIWNTSGPIGSSDHPHVSSRQPCWGDLTELVVQKQTGRSPMDLVDIAITLLLSYNAGSAFTRLDFWAYNLPEEKQFCATCLKPFVPRVLTSRTTVKCTCETSNLLSTYVRRNVIPSALQKMLDERQRVAEANATPTTAPAPIVA